MNGLIWDGTINAGQIASAVVFLLTGGAIWGSTKNRLDTVQKDLSGIQIEFKKLTDIVIANAARDEREKALSARVDKIERQIEERIT